MMTRISAAIAAGLLLAAPAFAEDEVETPTVETPTQDRIQLKDGTGDGTPDRLRIHQTDVAEGEATGDELRTQTRTQAREQVRAALAEQAGMPGDGAALPGEGAGEQAAGRHVNQNRKMETERAALRHAERTAAREQAGEGSAVRKGAGGGHGGMAGSGPGAGDCTDAAEKTRSGEMRGPGMMR